MGPAGAQLHPTASRRATPSTTASSCGPAWRRPNLTGDNDHGNQTVSGSVELYSHETDAFVRASKAPVCVEWNVAPDPDFHSVVSSGTAYTSSDIDFTVKVEARKLKAFTTYCQPSLPAAHWQAPVDS